MVPDGELNSIPDGTDINLLQIKVTPYPVPINRAVTLPVAANDGSTGSPVAGKVHIDRGVVANTNASCTHTFVPKRCGRPPEQELIYPKGNVTATGYPDISIDFGFPE